MELGPISCKGWPPGFTEFPQSRSGSSFSENKRLLFQRCVGLIRIRVL